MLVLAIDTSTEALSVAVGDLDGSDASASGAPTRGVPTAGVPSPGVPTAGVPTPHLLAQRAEVAPHRHTERLSPLVAETLAAAGVSGGELGAVAVGLGPGPFTGLRVGIVTAAAMADAYGVPVYGESSLDVLAASVGHTAQAQAQAPDRDLVVVVPARRNQVYWARYSPSGTLLDGPAIGRPDELAAGLDASRVLVAGVGARHTYREVFAGFDLADTDYPSAEVLVARVATRCVGSAPSDDLAPMYLRPPDAVPPAALAGVLR